jgi:hypothetical protein
MTSPRTTTPPKRHDVLGVWKKPAPTTVTALAGARGQGHGREHRVHAAVRGDGKDHDRGEKEREARERA